MSNAHLLHILSSAYSSTTLDEQLRYQRRLLRLQEAVTHYRNNGADRHRWLQDALRDVTLPDGINMQSVEAWIQSELLVIAEKIAETQKVQEQLSLLREQDRIVRDAQKRATSIRRHLKNMVGKTVFA